jgi:hypothetical protein
MSLDIGKNTEIDLIALYIDDIEEILILQILEVLMVA